jgi:hypothetical protein
MPSVSNSPTTKLIFLQFPQMIGSLVVASNKQRQNRRLLLS